MSRDGPRTFVYFIATEDRSMVKIGCSKSPPNRLGSLACWSPNPLVILAAVRGSIKDEHALHERYFDLHSHHEWFRSSSQMLADAARIARLDALPPEFRAKKNQRNPLIVNTIRATPEWRAKMSVIHKARWAKEKRERELERELLAILAEQGITTAAAHATFLNAAPFGVRHNGTIWISNAAGVVAYIAKLKRSREAA
jgi:hypothetical protein